MAGDRFTRVNENSMAHDQLQFTITIDTYIILLHMTLRADTSCASVRL